jgi:hypothetical protein
MPVYPGLAYQGPPRMEPPPAGWRPERIVTPSAPRRLPGQDHARIDQEEAQALTVTRMAAIATGAILLILMCALCARWVF